jgi:hypothetical protein
MMPAPNDAREEPAPERRPPAGDHSVNINVLYPATDTRPPILERTETLCSLPSSLHLFKDPRHVDLVAELDARRVLVLSSYRDYAALAVAYSLVADGHFDRQDRRMFNPATPRKDRGDVDIVTLTDAQILDVPQVVIIEIKSRCAFFDELPLLANSVQGMIRDRLESRHSYFILAVDEELLPADPSFARELSFAAHSVDHLRYLFRKPHLPERAGEVEERLRTCVEHGGWKTERRELYQRVHALLGDLEKLNDFVSDIERAMAQAPEVWAKQLQTVRPEAILEEGSEAHRTTAFVAAFLPDLGEREFERFVKLLLADSTVTEDRERSVRGDDGAVRLVRESVEELWQQRWDREADAVFRHLHLAAAKDTSIVDFTEPYLRRELRAHLEAHHSWFVLRKCEQLQASGTFFQPNLSQAAVEALVQLFIDRAVRDPIAFGPGWLLTLVLSAGIQIKGDAPDGTPEERFEWLMQQLTIQAQLLAHFYLRLAVLVREMLDRDQLRPMVRAWFQLLISAGKHRAAVDVLLTLARQLRFSRHFEPLEWLRPLLDQGDESIRGHVQGGIFEMASRSGPSTQAMIAGVRAWLPEPGRPPERFSPSNRFALDFLYEFGRFIEERLPESRFATWPTAHPLFFAMPAESELARGDIRTVIEWLLDPRGATLESAVPGDPRRSAEVVRMERLAGLIEHWAWVLEGGDQRAPAEGRALFAIVFEELARQSTASQRVWLTRSWQARRDGFVAMATRMDRNDTDRKAAIRRQTKLDQLRSRFVLLAGNT